MFKLNTLWRPGGCQNVAGIKIEAPRPANHVYDAETQLSGNSGTNLFNILAEKFDKSITNTIKGVMLRQPTTKKKKKNNNNNNNTTNKQRNNLVLVFKTDRSHMMKYRCGFCKLE